jgi:hypothetical protein
MSQVLDGNGQLGKVAAHGGIIQRQAEERLILIGGP